jgi:hypothetical protein
MRTVFAAVHESVVDPSRHIAAPREFGRKRGIADIDGQPSIAKRDACDPSETFAGGFLQRKSVVR